MAAPTYLLRPASLCLRCFAQRNPVLSSFPKRDLATTSDESIQGASPLPPPRLPPQRSNASLASSSQENSTLSKTEKQLIGSRRRRAAINSTTNIPFEQLPYQCFQEARKVLLADREDKLKKIEVERKRIAKVQARDAAQLGGEARKKGKLIAMHKYLEHLKILADSNDPVIKKRFEDGLGNSTDSLLFSVLHMYPHVKTSLTIFSTGDMNRPIYRYLADRQWRSYRRLLLVQRITQMNLVPDLLPNLDPTAEVSLAFGPRAVSPGEFLDSRITETPPKLRIQVFSKGERLVTIVVVDPDVPNETKDGFDYRCHFLAVNVPVSPTVTSVPFSRLKPPYQITLPWLPPHAQKGAPYHRLSIFVLEQPAASTRLDLSASKINRDGFNLRSFIDRYHLEPIGVNIFRTKWDDNMDEVMRRHSLEGAEVEYVRAKPEKLPYKKKDGARYR